MKQTLPNGFKFIDVADMTQGHLEKWQRVFNADYSAGQAVYDGAIVRATIAAGWFVECPWKVEDVAKQPIKGNLVPIVSSCVDDFYIAVKEFAAPDPN